MSENYTVGVLNMDGLTILCCQLLFHSTITKGHHCHRSLITFWVRQSQRCYLSLFLTLSLILTLSLTILGSPNVTHGYGSFWLWQAKPVNFTIKVDAAAWPWHRQWLLHEAMFCSTWLQNEMYYQLCEFIKLQPAFHLLCVMIQQLLLTC